MSCLYLSFCWIKRSKRTCLKVMHIQARTSQWKKWILQWGSGNGFTLIQQMTTCAATELLLHPSGWSEESLQGSKLGYDWRLGMYVTVMCSQRKDSLCWFPDKQCVKRSQIWLYSREAVAHMYIPADTVIIYLCNNWEKALNNFSW